MVARNNIPHPGLIALMGSGETSPNGGKIFEAVAQRLSVPIDISVLETPAGFELNSDRVAGRVADYIKVRLQNYRPVVNVIPARKRNTFYSPDEPTILTPLLRSQMIFMGPGSPSYTVRQLAGSLAWDMIQARQRLGCALVFASAAAIAVGSLALPVYEIYKVGEDPHWKMGLDLFAPYGLKVIVVSHWNNTEGGAYLDTSRCYIGKERFDLLLSQVPDDMTVVGLDEQTGLILDFFGESCQVFGRNSVHLVKAGKEQTFTKGRHFPIGILGDFHLPDDFSQGIRADAWKMVWDANEQSQLPVNIHIPQQVLSLVERREAARVNQDWEGADDIRKMIADMGWRVIDTPDGPKVEPMIAV